LASPDQITYSLIVEEGEAVAEPSKGGSPGRRHSRLLTSCNAFLERLVPSGGLTASIFELLSATLGAGSMALPFCFKESGLILATALLFVGALSAFYSIHLLSVVSNITGQKSYEELVNHVFGKKVELILDMAIIIFTYGSTVAYIVVIGDTLPPLAELIGLDADAFYTQRWFLMFIATATLIFPLALLKQLSSLRFTAILGFCATLYLLSAMFYRVAEQFQFVGGMEVIQNVEMAQINLNFFVAAPIVFYAFSSHVNIFSISNELRNPTPQRIDTVILGNVLLAMLVYGMIGLCGYLTFLDETDDNVINNYDTYDIPIQVGSFLLTMAVILNVPLNTHPLRVTVDWMVFGPNSRIPQAMRYYGEVFILVFTALAVAVLVPSITVIFGLLGATATSLCCYIMPAVLFLRVSPLPWYHYQLWPCMILIIAATVSGIASTVIIIIDLIKKI